MKKILFLLLIATQFVTAQNRIFFLAPTGTDAGTGAISSPWRNASRLNTVSPALTGGDTVYLRGGTYRSTAGPGDNNNAAGTHFQFHDLLGLSMKPLVIMAYPGEVPMFNMDNIVPTVDNVFGMDITNCRYVWFKGFVIKNLAQVASGAGVNRGLRFESTRDCTIELFDIFDIGGTGFTLDHSDNNLILNCDSHNNGDGMSPDTWNFGDGFTCTGGDPSTGNVFRGCRAWMNGDDGWDFFAWSGTKVTIQNCWSLWESVKPWGPSGTQPNEVGRTVENSAVWLGNPSYYTVNLGESGEGFKFGGFNVGGPGPVGMPTVLKKYVDHCLSVENNGTGFSANMQAQYSHQMQMLNCISYRNNNDGFGFGVGRSIGIAMVFKNNWSFDNDQQNSGGDWVYDGLPDNVSNNYWGTVYQGVNYGNLKGTVTLTTADFLSVTPAGLTGPRKPDGSLPDITYLHLKPGSDLIDQGTDGPVNGVIIPKSGVHPDLGAFEFQVSTNIPPVSNAGNDLTITLPVNTAPLTGAGTDADGTVSSYVWTKISGPTTYTIANPNIASTFANNLVQGTYQFQLQVTDNSGATGTDIMQVIVNPAPANQLPVANAGPDRVITLPTNTTSLSGSGTDADGTIVSYLWNRITGPAAYAIVNPNAAITNVTSLIQGAYQFELTVTDNSGGSRKDTMRVTVNFANNILPVANAGADKIITLPVNTTALTGTGTDSDGTISAYLWRQLTGPVGTGNIATATNASTIAFNLVQGTYTFELKVTDNNGGTNTDTISVLVNPVPPNILPVTNAGADQNITIPTTAVTLSGTGTDADGTIASYQWIQTAGNICVITNSALASTTVTGLGTGIYKFQLKVTDNVGGFALDEMIVTVNAGTTKTINVNIYNGLNGYSNWNNWRPYPGVESGRFRYTTNATSNITAKLTKQQKVANNGARYLIDSTTSIPKQVYQFYSVNVGTRSLIIRHLNPAKTYTIKLYASNNISSSGTSTFTVGVVNDVVTIANNGNDIAQLNSLTPDGSGTIEIVITGSNGMNSISGFTIMEQ